MCVCERRREEGRKDGRRAEVHNQKQEPHTMMWGKKLDFSKTCSQIELFGLRREASQNHKPWFCSCDHFLKKRRATKINPCRLVPVLHPTKLDTHTHTFEKRRLQKNRRTCILFVYFHTQQPQKIHML